MYVSILMCATDETRPEHVCCKDRKDLAARAAKGRFADSLFGR
jgi:hypothetical protein